MLLRYSRAVFLVVAALPLVAMSAATLAQQDAGGLEGTSKPRPRFAIFHRDREGPPYFSLELEPGQSATLTATVGALDSPPVALRAYVSNAHSQPNGGFGAGTDDEQLSAPAAWIAFPAQYFNLRDRQEIDIPFTVAVPLVTPPGQYVAALVAQTDEPLPVQHADSLNVVVRSAIAVVITVPGPPSPAFTLGEAVILSDGAQTVVIPIENTGNVLVRPAGVVTVSTPAGDQIASLPVAMDSVYAGTAATIEIRMPLILAAGEYIVAGSLIDPDTGVSASLQESIVTLGRVKTSATDVLITGAKVTPVGDPVHLADIAITLENNGHAIPSTAVVLEVSLEGIPLETYIVAGNQAIPIGVSTIVDRYVPFEGWEAGTYEFEIIVYSADEQDTETVIATVEVEDRIEIP